MADDLPPAAPAEPTPPPPISANAADAAPSASAIDPTSIEELLKQASFDDPAALQPPGGAAADGPPLPDLDDFKLPSFQQVIQEAQASSIELLRDVELNVKIELGRSRMLVEDVLKLAEGSVVELDKLAGDPVD